MNGMRMAEYAWDVHFYYYRRDKALRERGRVGFFPIITRVWGQQS
jgi:hypothetical protein